ncbi:ATP-binding protein [Streptomyces sp. NPDC048659]|uniref:AAA family ATPase n=1 Tax=Streptomyces sp. NPDC048659 TaxID=3155489 RepID=UPI003424B0C0
MYGGITSAIAATCVTVGGVTSASESGGRVILRQGVSETHDVALASGNHRAPGHHPNPTHLAAVHHFKWCSGIVDDLRRRVTHLSSGTWQEHMQAVRDEASRLLTHLNDHCGTINLADPRFAFRCVGLDQLPYQPAFRGPHRPHHLVSSHPGRPQLGTMPAPSRNTTKTARMPLTVLLIGITGSGKTTLAKALAERGSTHLSVDEEVHRLHGRYGIDYPEHTYFEREHLALETIHHQLTAGHDVVLDHGLWTRADRTAWQTTVRQAGGHPVLVYLLADRDELLARLKERHNREDADALTVTPDALDDFLARRTSGRT